MERSPEPCPEMSIRVRTLASNPFSNLLRTCTQLAQILHPKWTTRKAGWVRALHRSAASPGVWAFSVLLRVAHYFRCRCLDLLVAGQAVGPRRRGHVGAVLGSRAPEDAVRRYLYNEHVPVPLRVGFPKKGKIWRAARLLNRSSQQKPMGVDC